MEEQADSTICGTAFCSLSVMSALLPDYQLFFSHYKSLRLAWILSLIQSLFCMVANRMSSISAASSSSPVRVYTALCGSQSPRVPGRNSCSLWMRKWYSIWSCKVLRLCTECVHKDLNRIYWNCVQEVQRTCRGCDICVHISFRNAVA